MKQQIITTAQTAGKLGCSDRTVRKYAAILKLEMFGNTYRVADPADVRKIDLLIQGRGRGGKEYRKKRKKSEKKA